MAPKLGIRSPGRSAPALTSNPAGADKYLPHESNTATPINHNINHECKFSGPGLLNMAGVIQREAPKESINGVNAEGHDGALIDRAVAEKAPLNRAASLPQAGHILTGRQEHCTEVPPNSELSEDR